MLMVTSWWKLMVTSCHIMLWESLDAVGHFAHDENPLVSCWWPNSEVDAYNQVISELCNGTFRFKQNGTKARTYRGTFRVCLLLFFFFFFFRQEISLKETLHISASGQIAVVVPLPAPSEAVNGLWAFTERQHIFTLSAFRLCRRLVEIQHWYTMIALREEWISWWDVKRHSSGTTSDLGRNYSLLYSLSLFSSW